MSAEPAIDHGSRNLLIGVVSDTHGQVEHTRRALCVLAEFEPAAVLHCGDIGSAAIVPLFAPWPTHFVWGNVDEEITVGLRAAIDEAGQTCHEFFGAIELASRRIALLHGHEARRYREAAVSGEWDLIASGHTHVAHQKRQGTTLLLNPGAVFRANPHSIAIVDLTTMEPQIVSV